MMRFCPQHAEQPDEVYTIRNISCVLNFPKQEMFENIFSLFKIQIFEVIL